MFQGNWHAAQIVLPENSRTENKKIVIKSAREAFNANKLENKQYNKLESKVEPRSAKTRCWSNRLFPDNNWNLRNKYYMVIFHVLKIRGIKVIPSFGYFHLKKAL